MNLLSSRRARHRTGPFQPRVELLEDRCVLDCDVTVVGSALKIAGTNAAEHVKITDFNGGGGSGIVSVKCGNLKTTATGIIAILVNLKGGNDKVEYELQAPSFLGHTTRLIGADLGSGHDKFTSSLEGSLEGGSSVHLVVHGKTGKDTISVGNLAHVDAGAELGMGLYGGDNNDKISVSYIADLDGKLDLKADGGAGHDTVSAVLGNFWDKYFTGGQGSSAEIRGGSGNDLLQGTILNPAGSWTTIHGDDGWDVIQRSLGVVADTFEVEV